MKNYFENKKIEEMEYIDFKSHQDRLGEEKVNYWYIVALIVLFIVYSAI